METVETIYEVIVELYYFKTTRSDSNRYGHSRQMRGVAASPKTYSKMGKCTGKSN